MYTPAKDAKKILPFLTTVHVTRNKPVIYECCYGAGHMARSFEEEGYTVVGSADCDFFSEHARKISVTADVIVTNPPFRENKIFLERAFELNDYSKTPFAFLCRLEHLGGVKAHELFSERQIQIIIPKRRINFITPKMRRGIDCAGSSFHSMWITYGLGLEKDITWID